jgi:hypothetical protein
VNGLFPDREWWWSQFLGTEGGGGGGETGDGEDGDDKGDGEQSGGDGEDGDKSAEDQLADALEALRKERSDHRKAKRELAAAKKGTGTTGNRKSGGASGSDDRTSEELETQRSVIEDLRKEVRAGKAEREVRTTAEKAGAANTDRIFRIIRTDIEYDDDGNPDNVADLIADVKKDYPELFKKRNGTGDLGGGGSSNKKSGKGDFFRQLIESEE